MNTTKNTSNTMTMTMMEQQKRRTLVRREAATKGRKVAAERRKTADGQKKVGTAEQRKAPAAKKKNNLVPGSAPAGVVGTNTKKKVSNSIRKPTFQLEREGRILARNEAIDKRKVAVHQKKVTAAGPRKAAAVKKNKPARGSAPADVVGANTNKVQVSSILTLQQTSLSTTSVVPQSLSTSNVPSEAKGATSVCWALKREAEEQANARGVIGRALIKRKAGREAEEQARREAKEQANARGVIGRALIKRKAGREAEEQARREAEEQANAGGAIGGAFIMRRPRWEAMEEGAERDAEVQADASRIHERAIIRRKARWEAKREAEKQAIGGCHIWRANIMRKAMQEAKEQARHEAEEQAKREVEEKANSAGALERAFIKIKARREGRCRSLQYLSFPHHRQVSR